MLIEKDVNKLLRELPNRKPAQVFLNGFSVTVNMMDQGSRLLLNTPVYRGGNYIPNSVRSSLKKKAPFDRLEISTSLEVDEENYSISLKYYGEVKPSGYSGIVELLEDFSWLAEKWREYLEEQDKNDLIRVPVK